MKITLSLSFLWTLHLKVPSCSALHTPRYTQEEGWKSRLSAKVSGDVEATLSASPGWCVKNPFLWKDDLDPSCLGLSHPSERRHFSPRRKKICFRTQRSPPFAGLPSIHKIDPFLPPSCSPDAHPQPQRNSPSHSLELPPSPKHPQTSILPTPTVP